VKMEVSKERSYQVWKYNNYIWSKEQKLEEIERQIEKWLYFKRKFLEENQIKNTLKGEK